MKQSLSNLLKRAISVTLLVAFTATSTNDRFVSLAAHQPSDKLAAPSLFQSNKNLPVLVNQLISAAANGELGIENFLTLTGKKSLFYKRSSKKKEMIDLLFSPSFSLEEIIPFISYLFVVAKNLETKKEVMGLLLKIIETKNLSNEGMFYFLRHCVTSSTSSEMLLLRGIEKGIEDNLKTNSFVKKDLLLWAAEIYQIVQDKNSRQWIETYFVPEIAKNSFIRNPLVLLLDRLLPNLKSAEAKIYATQLIQQTKKKERKKTLFGFVKKGTLFLGATYGILYIILFSACLFKPNLLAKPFYTKILGKYISSKSATTAFKAKQLSFDEYINIVKNLKPSLENESEKQASLFFLLKSYFQSFKGTQDTSAILNILIAQLVDFLKDETAKKDVKKVCLSFLETGQIRASDYLVLLIGLLKCVEDPSSSKGIDPKLFFPTYHTAFEHYRNRVEEAKISKIADLIAREKKDMIQIYSNSDFLSKTSTLNFGERHSIAYALKEVIKRFWIAVNDGSIQYFLPYILEMREVFRDRVLLGEETPFILILNEEFEAQEEEIVRFAKERGVKNIQVFVGPSKTEEILKAIATAPARTTIMINAHGSKDVLSLKKNPLTEEDRKKAQLLLKELHKALEKRAQSNNGSLSDLNLIYDSCVPLDQLQTWFSDCTVDGSIISFPLIVTTGNRSMVVSTNFLEIIKKVEVKPGKKLLLESLYEAESKTIFLKSPFIQDPVILVPVTKDFFDLIKENIEYSDPAKDPSTDRFLPLFEIGYLDKKKRPSTLDSNFEILDYRTSQLLFEIAQ